MCEREGREGKGHEFLSPALPPPYPSMCSLPSLSLLLSMSLLPLHLPILPIVSLPHISPPFLHHRGKATCSSPPQGVIRGARTPLGGMDPLGIWTPSGHGPPGLDLPLGGCTLLGLGPLWGYGPPLTSPAKCFWRCH